jgi:aminoglycoside phosphotransferase (APT) family kinase protein
MTLIDKNNPSPEWIESLRKRFPTEKEMDRVLTRKLQRRAGPGYSPVSLETFTAALQSLLRAELKDPFEIRDIRWLSGGASKLQVAFRLEWNQPGVGRTSTPMVIRMEPAESIVETSRLREFQIIKAVEEVLPVPPVYWIDDEPKYFPYPTIIYGFAEGVVKPSGSTTNVSGLGVNFGPELRKVIGKQYIDQLAALHTWDWSKTNLSSLDVPPVGKSTFQMHLNWWRRVWEEDSNREVPLLRLAANWLDDNMPAATRLSMIHGDWRAGNFLFTEHNQRISAWLDWELGHLGDFHEDVAYILRPDLGHYAEDGKTYLYSGILPRAEMCEAYEKATGFTINEKSVKYYDIFHQYRSAVIVIASGYRPALNGKTHQDLLLTWIMGFGYLNLENLRKMMEEVA